MPGTSALSKQEFLAYITRFNPPRDLKVRTGVREFARVLDTMPASGRTLKRGHVDRTILSIKGSPYDIELITLSPSDGATKRVSANS